MSELREKVEGDIQKRLRRSTWTHRGFIIGSLIFGVGIGIDSLDGRAGDAAALVLTEGVVSAAIVGIEKSRAKLTCDRLVADYSKQNRGADPYLTTEVVTLGQGLHVAQVFDEEARHGRAVKSAPMYGALAPSLADLGGFGVCALLPANETSKLQPELSAVFGGIGGLGVVMAVKVSEHLTQVDADMLQTYQTRLNNIDEGFAFGSGRAPEAG